MYSDSEYSKDSVRSLIYLLYTGQTIHRVNDFECRDISNDLPFIIFSRDIGILEVKEVYLNILAIYKVADLSVKSFPGLTMDSVISRFKEYFRYFGSVFKDEVEIPFYKIEMKDLYDTMEDYFRR